MADTLLQRAGERFCAHLSDDEKGTIESMQKLDDVKVAIRQVEQHLAARQSLRNLQRLSPFLEATERLTGFVDVLANGTPFLPYVWAPLKLILRAAQDHSKVLDKILTAYGSIGMALPRMTRYGDTFPDNYELQQLLGHLLEDIIDFHSRAYRLMRKPGWHFFFSAAWGRFEHYFDSLLQGIARNSELIDKEAASVDIIEAREWRQKSRELASAREKKWETDQRDAVISWLQDGDAKQDDTLEWLRNRCYEGTSQWLLKSSKVRSWLQYRKGPQVLWLDGKPGSGKSILCSQLIYFLRTSNTRACLFFFCNYQTPGFAVTVQILRNVCAQIVRMSPDLAPYIYDEFLTKGRTPTFSALKPLLLELFKSFEDIRIIVDGVDEIESGQHSELLKTLIKLVEATDNCKLLVSSQDIPSIKMNFRRKSSFSVGADSSSTEVKKDIDLILGVRLEEINDRFDGAVSQTILDEMRQEILDRANGMFLWVSLVLNLLEESTSVQDLRQNIEELPPDLEKMYDKILINIISRRSSRDARNIYRVFSWMLFQKGKHPLRKHELRLGMILHAEQTQPNRDNKPIPNALDACKPFIEDGPGASVVFIHSTVPQFLLSKASEPFSNVQESSCNILLVCLSQLAQGLSLVSETARSGDLYSVCHGFHALIPYAHEYWIEHLLDYVEQNQECETTETSHVKALVLQLYSQSGMINLSSEDENRSMKSHVAKAEVRLDNCLAWFDDLPGASDFIRHRIRMRQPAMRSIVPHLNDDFSQINYSYHDCVLKLLSLHSCEGLSSEDLVVFKREFGPSAFVCRVQGCDKSIFGFDSDARLRDHSALHQGKLRCSISNCLMNDVGFTSAKALRDHKRIRHPESLPPRIPKKISDPPERDVDSLEKNLDPSGKAQATVTQYQPPDGSAYPQRPTKPRPVPNLTPEQIAHLNPEQRAKYEQMKAGEQAVAAAVLGDFDKLRRIGQDRETAVTPHDITNAQKENPEVSRRPSDTPASMLAQMPQVEVTPNDIMNARKANPKTASLTDDQLRDFIIQIKQRRMAAAMQKEMAMRMQQATERETSTTPPKETNKV